MAKALQLPIIDLASPDRISTANSIRQEIPEVLPSWRPTIESYYERVLTAGKKLISLIALALNLDEDFFEKVGAFNPPMPFLRLLHYPGELGLSDEEIFGASAHSDYGMITFLATDGVGGLQACLVCRDKSKQPLVWEDVDHINGALIVNIGDMTERWTNCLFRSTLHRVVSTGRERYSLCVSLHCICIGAPRTPCLPSAIPERFAGGLSCQGMTIRLTSYGLCQYGNTNPGFTGAPFLTIRPSAYSDP
ncbi:hypothetical protein HYC85_027616 [Camellia sinensis]|uniref:Fe2OG dioxygenase domain-containing protein n=1 Tax=Camellia sinensis TaxID=4442 RepID=A0A7J7G779_CAMSI|nr:hypothetical protein HYC85_027616 [Camellia sinensis]